MNANNHKRFNEIFNNSRRILMVVAFGILLYEFLENFTAVSKAVKGFFEILAPLFIGILLAFIANMPLNFLEKRVFKKLKRDKLRRGICAMIAFLLVYSVIAAVGFLIVPKLIDSIVSLAEGFDSYISSFAAWADKLWRSIDLPPEVEEKAREIGADFLLGFNDAVSGVANGALKITISVLGFAVNFLIAMVLSFYLLYKKEKLTFGVKKLIVAALSEERAKWLLDISARTYKSLHEYFYGMIVECTILGLMTYITMLVFRFPYALLISSIVGVTQMVPIIGPWVAGAVGVLIILVTDPPAALWFAVALIIVQQVEANLIYPHVVGKAVGLSGIWVLLAVILGNGLFGMVGVVLSVPVMAVLYTMISEWINRRVEQKRYEKGMRGEPPTEAEIKKMTEP